MTTAAVILLVLHILGGGLTDISKAITIVQQIGGQVVPTIQPNQQSKPRLSKHTRRK